MQMQRWTTLCLVLINLAACAGSKDTVLPSQGPDMKAIYQRHMSDIGLDDRRAARAALHGRPLQSAAADLDGYVRDAFNELNTRFPQLPNPVLVLYVFPHLAGAERVPVPGYATTFPLYTRMEYALPGELALPQLRQPDRP